VKEEILKFTFEGTEEIRAIQIDGEPWFVGKDVAEILEYSRPTKAIQDHVDDEDKDEVPIRDSIGRMQKTPIINESGLYSLILSSKLPTAKKFKRWVTSVVLPSIRKHGMFATEKTIDQMLEDPDTMIKVLTEMKEERAKRRLAEEKAAKLEPKAKFCDVVLQNPSLVNVTVIAKDYGMSAQAMNKLLKKLGVQYDQHGVWFLYAKYQSNGWTQSTTSVVKGKDGAEKSVIHTKWTQKGRLGLYELLKDYGLLPVIEREN
jgi:prophage antirepressor-like protein